MNDKKNIRAAYILIGQAVEALFYDADFITRLKLIGKLHMLCKSEILEAQKPAIDKAIKILS